MKEVLLTLWILLWPVDILVKRVALISYSLKYTYLDSEFFKVNRTYLSVQLPSDELNFNCQCRTASNITFHISAFFFFFCFGKWNVLFEIQTLKNVYIISANAGSLVLEIITTLEAMGTQLFLDI